MTDAAELNVDAAAIGRDVDRLVRGYLRAGARAVAGTTRALEQRLEDDTRAAVPGKLWRAWASESFPKGGREARAPSGIVYLNGGAKTRAAMRFWTEPGAARGKRGQYLAVPLPTALPRGRARDLTPEEWESNTGQKLRFVPRRGRAPLLVADGGRVDTRSGRYRQGSNRKAGPSGRGATVPIFVLLPLVRFRNAVAVEPQVQRAEGELVAAFLREAVRT